MELSKPVLITIITVCYQAATTVEKTIASVIEQEPIYEYIIIDGCSNDGTVEIIKKYHKSITYWISEKDTGIYEAMNKAINKSAGEWIYFLGADDVLEYGVLSKVKTHLTNSSVMVCGDVIFDNGHLIKSFLGCRTLLQNTVHHQSAFYRKLLFDQFRYDTSLKAIADYEMNIRLLIHELPFQYVPILIATCQSDGISSSLALSLKETNYVRKKYIRSNIYNKILSFMLWLYYSQKYIRYFFRLTGATRVKQ